MRWMGWLLWGVEAAGGVVVVVLVTFDAIDRPWARRRKR